MAEENKKQETEKIEKKAEEKNAANADKDKNINKQKVVEKPSEIKEEKKEETVGDVGDSKVKIEQETPSVETKKPEPVPEKEYTIPLRRNFNRVPRYKRTNKAVKAVKEFLVRHMKVYDRDLNKIKIDKHLNEFLWLRGIKKPPAQVKVKVKKDGENVIAELSEMPKKIEFKKARLDKREKKAMEFVAQKKKTLAERMKQSTKPEDKLEGKIEEQKQTPEEKVEEKEKAKAGEEAMQKLERAAAKTARHTTKDNVKQPKRQQRKALAK